MNTIRIALANLSYPSSPAHSVRKACDAVASAAKERASVVCFPECFVPGYRAAGKNVPPPDGEFLREAWSAVATEAKDVGVAVVLGTERVAGDGPPLASVLVIRPDGALEGFQDKVQIDPSEEGLYASGEGRRTFRADTLTFGIAICHEGWRYPETVRWAARRGAQLVFHPHFHEASPGGFRPTRFGDPANTFHEKAALCRAAENGCWFATVNYASEGSPTTSAVIRPDGTLLDHQPYGEEGLLVADVDLDEATGLLASRLRPDAFEVPRAR